MVDRVLVAVVVAVVACQLHFGKSDQPVPVNSHTVDLDLPAEKRWAELVVQYKQIVPFIQDVLRSEIPKDLVPVVEFLAANIDQYLGDPYAGEIKGIANALNTSVGGIVGVNLLYDVSAFCTSIVSQDVNKKIWHSRNLDYSFTDMLRNVTIKVDFLQNKQTVYSAITYVGYVGILTGQKPKAFTITVDERDQGALWENLLIAILDRKAVPVSFLVRDALAKSATYKDAVERLSFTTTAASVYYIIGGANPGEGMVITKGRLAEIDEYPLDPDNNRWYVVETNYDHWKPPPTSDDRRTPAIKAMNAMGNKNITKESLFNVMSTIPVMNNKTTYTVVMSAADPGQMQAWVRNCCP